MRSRVRSENPSAKIAIVPKTNASVRVWLAIFAKIGSWAGRGTRIMLVKKWEIWLRSSLCLRSSPKIIGSRLGGVGDGGGGGGGSGGGNGVGVAGAGGIAGGRAVLGGFRFFFFLSLFQP